MAEEIPKARAPHTEGGAKSPRPRKSNGLTQSQVAALAGVAPITVSRVFNTPSAVSPKVLKRVREAIELTGYVPNLLAGGLASRKSKLVALVVPTIIGPVFQETVQSLTEELANHGYQLMLGQTGYENSREDALLDAIIGRRSDGVILTGIMRSAQGRRRLLASGIPVVETWDLSETPIDMLVGFSHERLGAAVAQYLHQRGRRAAAMISATDDRARRRNQAFSDAAVHMGMAKRGASAIPTCMVPAPTTLGSGRSGLRNLLKQAPHIDALFCSSDLVALGALIEAKELGIQVPQQLAVVGFGDLGFAPDLSPALTTVRVDGQRIGRIAARFIIDRTEGRVIGEPIIDVGFSIIERASA